MSEAIRISDETIGNVLGCCYTMLFGGTKPSPVVFNGRGGNWIKVYAYRDPVAKGYELWNLVIDQSFEAKNMSDFVDSVKKGLSGLRRVVSVDASYCGIDKGTRLRTTRLTVVWGLERPFAHYLPGANRE